jgi:hypothetical protein
MLATTNGRSSPIKMSLESVEIREKLLESRNADKTLMAMRLCVFCMHGAGKDRPRLCRVAALSASNAGDNPVRRRSRRLD